MTFRTDGFTPSVLIFFISFLHKRFILIVLLSFLIIKPELFAQKISKDYSMSIQEKGLFYFIYPQKGFNDVKSKDEFTFDLTYLDSTDSLTLNFTYTNKELLKIDSIAIKLANEFIKISPSNKLYVEMSKSKWIYRYTAQFSFSDLDNFFSSNTKSPEILLFDKNKESQLKAKESNWKKISNKNARIFNLIKANKKELLSK